MASKSSENNDEEPMVFTNYKPTLHKRFAEMFHSKQLTDAIIICENQRIHVHKFLLSASSSFFNKMFKKPGANILHIKIVKHADLVMILEYIYNGEVALPQNRIAGFLNAAKKLSIPISAKDIESVTLKCGLSFEQQNQNDDDFDMIDDDDNDGDRSCDEKIEILDTKQTKRCEVIRIDKHNLHDENRKTPGVVEVSREEFLKRMFSVSKSSKKSNSNSKAETKQNPSNRLVVDAAEPSTSNGPTTVTGGPDSDEKIQMRRNNIEALRHRIMRNVKKGINNEKIEKDRLLLIKLEADLVKALKNLSE